MAKKKKPWQEFTLISLSALINGVLYKERWRSVKGYEGSYKISNFGRIKSLKRIVIIFNGVKRKHPEKIMQQRITNGGHCRISFPIPKKTNGIRFKGILTHRLVAAAFIKNKNSKPHINHIDGNKENNFYKNLEWCTVSENSLHAIRTGLYKPPKLPKLVRPVLCTKTGKKYGSIKDASKDFPQSSGRLYKMLSGGIPNTSGFVYATEKIIIS